MKRSSLAARLGMIFMAITLGACSATRTQEAPGEVIDDSTTTAKVKSALIADPVTKAYQVNVETYRGVVELGGFVDSNEQKTRATEVAKSVTGVREVRNDLKVAASTTTGQKVDDSMITAQVKTKLIADPATEAYKINVETKGGVVQLSGFVDSTSERQHATEVARSIGGVTSVDNDLEIRQKP